MKKKFFYILFFTLFCYESTIYPWFNFVKNIRTSYNKQITLHRSQKNSCFKCIKRFFHKKNTLFPLKLYSALFSHKDNIQKTLCSLIKNEKKQILIAAYIITDQIISQALIDAQKNGIEIELITDTYTDSKNKQFTTIDSLKKSGINIFIYKKPKTQKYGIMHHKFMLFKQQKAYGEITNTSLVSSGSYNFTNAAHQFNREVVLILNNPDIYQNFLEEYNTIKRSSEKF
jgi:phosphatidylserine/phosphatidylglycerophosphate/cardiolipin synthase-like enzyme